ncbi:MAG: hypothetical protein J6R04_05985 [Clostridia bacterium]|nr:hypothetical protein [Clostridia bacterium]
MKYALQQSCRQMKDALTRPEVRKAFHYECGIYRDKSNAAPIVSLRMSHRCRTPLWRMIAIASALTLLILFVRSCLCRLPLCKRRMRAHE